MKIKKNRGYVTPSQWDVTTHLEDHQYGGLS